MKEGSEILCLYINPREALLPKFTMTTKLQSPREMMSYSFWPCCRKCLHFETGSCAAHLFLYRAIDLLHTHKIHLGECERGDGFAVSESVFSTSGWGNYTVFCRVGVVVISYRTRAVWCLFCFKKRAWGLAVSLFFLGCLHGRNSSLWIISLKK